MAEDQRSLRAVYKDAEQRRSEIENRIDSNSSAFQDSLLSTIQLYEQCLRIADQISLFSPNEILEDFNTADLQYLLLNYRIAELLLRINGQQQHRKTNLRRAQRSYETYLKQLDNHGILSKEDTRLLEQYQEAPDTFSTAATSDPASRRETKIRRFKEEKALKQKLEHLQQNPKALQDDDNAHRSLQLANLAYCAHQTFQSLESLAQELHILSLAPPEPVDGNVQSAQGDDRERSGRQLDGYSERLDPPRSHLSAGLRGPLLDSKGKPLQPFTLLGKREDLRNGVFRPDHSLPTMSIDEYLEEERRRGGMIDGGGPQSQVRKEVDEDDFEAADRETMKAREWDEYVEANPRGSGNTMNRG